MKRRQVRWVILLPLILVVFLIILGGGIYKLKRSEAFSIGLRAAASRLEVPADDLRLAWWDSVTFAEGARDGGAEFSLCSPAKTCVKAIVTKRAGTWTLSELRRE